MARTAKAALCRAHNTPVVIEPVTVDGPKRGEVMVKLGACGVCHSDLSAITGTIALPLPLVLGHEGAGVVEEVGEGVSGRKGRHVVQAISDHQDLPAPLRKSTEAIELVTDRSVGRPGPGGPGAAAHDPLRGA